MVQFLPGMELWQTPGFLLHSWDAREGLPDARAQAAARTSDGYLWLGTSNGLARFDGHRFVVFTTNTTPELKDNRIVCLQAAKSGDLWIGTEGGHLVNYQAGKFSAVSLGGRESGHRINSFAEDNDGGIWIGTKGAGIARWRQGVSDWFNINNATNSGNTDVTQIVIDRQGRFWAVVDHQLAVFENGAWSIASGAASSEQLQVMCLAPSRDGSLWVATTATPRGSTELGNQLFRLDSNGWTEKPWASYPWGQSKTSQDQPGMCPTHLLEDKDGNLWLKIKGYGFYCRNSLQPEFKILMRGDCFWGEGGCLVECQDGIILSGRTNLVLATQIPRPFVSTISLPVTGKQYLAKTLCLRRDGSVWVGTWGAGVYRYQQGNVDKVDFGQGSEPDPSFINILFEDRQTNLWMGTDSGLFRKLEKGFAPLSDLQNPAVTQALKSQVQAICEDGRSNLWVGTEAGIVRLGPDGEKLFGRSDGLDGVDIRAIAEDHSGQIWAAVTGWGLYRKDGEHFYRCGAGQWSGENNIIDLHADADGALWITTGQNGVARFKDGKFSQWTKNDGMPADGILSVSEDAEGNLWFSSQVGIFGCPKSQLLSYQRGASPPIFFWKLSAKDGFQSQGTSGAGQPSLASSTDGRLWFPTFHDLVVFDPSKLLQSATNRTYPPAIEEVIVDGIKTMPDPDGALRVKSTTKSIEFHYTSPTLQSQDQLRFCYRLRGTSPDWTDAGSRRLANFFYLPIGQYEFEVKVNMPDGTWQNALQTLPVEVTPLFWERRSVQVIGIFGLLVFVTAIVWTVSRTRMRRRLAVMERQRALDQERSRIARDMHDEIGARLTQISLLSAIAASTASNENEVRAQTTKISTAARSLTRSLDEIVWAVRPQNDNLESLVDYLDGSMRDLCEDSPVRYWFSSPPAVPPVEVSANVRHNILLSCSEAVNNTLKHSGATEVRIGVRLRPQRLEIEITDNGRGFDVAKGEAKRSGLTHIRQRISDIGGSCECRSTPGEGTHFTFSVPLSMSLEDIPA